MSDSDSSTPSLNPLSSPQPPVPTSHLFNPLSFLSPSDSTYKHCMDALRITFNLAVSLHTDIDTGLYQLYTEGFDQEQIWQQLELWNVPTCQNLSADVQRLLTADIHILPVNEEINSVTSSPNHNQVDNEIEQITHKHSNNDTIQTDSDTNEPGIAENSLDSDEMEEFLQQEEKREDRSEQSSDSEGDIDELSRQEVSTANGLKYKDFFKEKSPQKPDTTQSNYSRVKGKIQARIEQLERDNMAEKDWKMSGEIRSMSRPDNSLLEGYMDHQAYPATPRITHEDTELLEDMICRRARDELWDDPVRREKPQEKRYNYSVPKQIDTQKSQLGLAEVYEQEFLKRTDPGSNALRTEEQAIEDEIKNMMRDVFTKLDALSNFRYTPKPFKYEPIVITNVPAISVEEVLPTANSAATRLAPEEISAPSGQVVSQIERTQEDKRKHRRHKKHVMSRKMVLRAQKLVNKTNPGLGNTYSKRKLIQVLTDAKHMQGQREQLIHDERARKRDKSFKSSKSFFSKLEAQTKNEILQKSEKKKSKVKHTLTAAALKLAT